jgi:hypothetical protein
MKKIFWIFCVLLCAGSHASDPEPFNLMGLPDDIIVYMSQFVEPDACRNLLQTGTRLTKLKPRIEAAQLPIAYKAIGKDYAKSLIQLPVPRWNLEERLPNNVRPLVHKWYLEGRKIKDPDDRFYYLMAAFRAGHYYAGLEIGDILINTTKVPLCVTLDDLAKIIPEYRDPAVREWDLTKLTENLIDDPRIRDINDYKKKLIDAATQEHVELCSKELNLERAISFHEHNIRQRRIILGEALEDLDERVDHELDEYHVFRTAYEHEMDSFEYNQVQSDLKRAESLLSKLKQNEPVAPHMEQALENMRKYGPEWVTYLRDKIESLPKPKISGYIHANAGRTNVPFYHDYLSDVYDINDQHKESYECLKAIQRLRLRPGNSLCMAEALHARIPSGTPEEVKNLEQEAKTLLMVSTLLGCHSACSFLIQDVGFLTLVAQPGKAQVAYDFYSQWHSMTAAIVQFNMLKNGNNPQSYADMTNCYYKYRSEADAAADICIHGARGDAAKQELFRLWPEWLEFN